MASQADTRWHSWASVDVFNLAQLTAAVGLDGANRNWRFPSERARVNVTRSIRSSIAAI